MPQVRIPPGMFLPQEQFTGQIPPTIASATKIYPSSVVSFISGTAQLETIVPPIPGVHQLVFIFTNAAPGQLLTSGNIGLGITPLQDASVSLFYDPSSKKYYPASGGSGGGGTNPAAPTTSVQFNDGGSFGGSTGLTFNKTVKGLGVGNTSIAGSSNLPLNPAFPTILDIEQTVTDFSVYTNGIGLNVGNGVLLNPAADTAVVFFSEYAEIATAGAHNFTGELLGLFSEFDHNGTGDISLAAGMSSEAYTDSSGNVVDSTYGIAGIQAIAGSYGSGTITVADGVRAIVRAAGTGTITDAAALHALPILLGGTQDTLTNYAGLRIDSAGYGTNRWAIRSLSIDKSEFAGTVRAAGFHSSDNSNGVTAGPFTAITAITVKNGLVTAITGS